MSIALMHHFKILKNERPYQGMNITGVMDITEAHKATLRALSAMDLGG